MATSKTSYERRCSCGGVTSHETFAEALNGKPDWGDARDHHMATIDKVKVIRTQLLNFTRPVGTLSIASKVDVKTLAKFKREWEKAMARPSAITMAARS